VSAEPVVPQPGLSEVEWQAVRAAIEEGIRDLARAGIAGAVLARVDRGRAGETDWQVRLEAPIARAPRRK
jgi:hypothetical protein